MTIVDIDHVQIAAPGGCEQKAREFFGSVVGMQEIDKPEKLFAASTPPPVGKSPGIHRDHLIE